MGDEPTDDVSKAGPSDNGDTCGQDVKKISNSGLSDIEKEEKPLKYPISVGFIVTNEFCERFSFYGMRTVLALYLHEKIGYSTDSATVIFHIFSMCVYFFPLLGAMIADNWLGKFKTIFYLSIVYAIGSTALTLGAVGPLGLPDTTMTIIGLLLIALGTGGIKPCVMSFGGDQFVLPQQENQLAKFFSLFYFAINSGSLISTFITPILRSDVKCFDEGDCFPLAFGVPGILMILSIAIFLFGKRFYTIVQPTGNVVLNVISCITHGLSRKIKMRKTDKREHWLDYANDKYDKSLIDDIKSTLKVLYLYIPLPVFWALFDQQGSRWTFQATQMNGKVGGYTIKPDQMQVLNPFLILAFIPLFDTVLYPLLSKCNLLTKPLKRLACGGVLAAVAFIISAVVELSLEKTYPVLPTAGHAQLRIYNGFECDIPYQLDGFDIKTIEKLDFHMQTLEINSASETFGVVIESSKCNGRINEKLVLDNKEAISYFFTKRDGKEVLMRFMDDVKRYDKGQPTVRFLMNSPYFHNISLKSEKGGNVYSDSNSMEKRYQTNVETYTLYIDDREMSTDPFSLELGGVYTLVINENPTTNQIITKMVTVTKPNTVHMLWLIPQYTIMTMGEVMYSVTGLGFSYSQAPVSMKSVVAAAWLLTTAVGNLIVIIIAEAKFFESQANEFFLFGGLMLLDMALFAWMAHDYKYIDLSSKQPDTISMSQRSVGMVDKDYKREKIEAIDN